MTYKCTWTLLSNLRLVIRDHGRPEAIRTDNEGMFASGLWGGVFKFFGIRHQRSAPSSPWQNGRIERLFGTLKPLLRQLTLPTTACLQNALDEFAGFYNHVRVHQALGGLTPAQAWRGVTLADMRSARQGQWMQALDGKLIGYHVRC